jgi:hypothetical protein
MSRQSAIEMLIPGGDRLLPMQPSVDYMVPSIPSWLVQAKFRGDVVARARRPDMPAPVKLAVALLAGMLAIGAVRSFLTPQPADPALPAWFGPVVVTSTTFVLGLLVLAIAFGRRWAVVTSVVLFVVGLPLSLPFAIHQFETSMGGFIVLIAQSVGQALAFSILFTRRARAWFAESRKARAA